MIIFNTLALERTTANSYNYITYIQGLSCSVTDRVIGYVITVWSGFNTLINTLETL